MATRVLFDHVENQACMYDSVTGFCFGPIFGASDNKDMDAFEVVNRFLTWFTDSDEVSEDDPRVCSDDLLESYQSKYYAQVIE